MSLDPLVQLLNFIATHLPSLVVHAFADIAKAVDDVTKHLQQNKQVITGGSLHRLRRRFMERATS